jgi:HEAT repeat protein
MRTLIFSFSLLVIAAVAAPTVCAADVAALAKVVGGKDVAKAQNAADQLGSLGDDAIEAVPALAAALKSNDVKLRQRAARALGAIGVAAKAAVPALSAALADEDPIVRAHAARALGLIGEAAKPATPALVKAITDTSAIVRRSAVRALSRIKPGPKVALPLFVKVLEDSDPAVIQPALHTLAELGKEAVPVMVTALKSKKARYWALLVLADIGADAEAAVPALQKLLSDKEIEVRMQTAIALAEIGPAAAPATAALTKALATDKLEAVRFGAAFALGRIGAKSAVTELKKSAQSKNEFLSMISLWALAKIQPEDKQAVSKAITVLTTALRHKEARIRRAAARGLVELDAPAELVAPALSASLKEANPEVLEEAITAIASMGAKVVPRAAARLKDGDDTLRSAAARVLAQIGAEAKEAAPALAEALVGAEGQFRREIQFALAAIGPASAPAVAELTKSLSAKDHDVRFSACYALGSIGPAAKSAAPALAKAIGGKEDFLDFAASWALVHIDGGNAKAVKHALPALVRGLSSDNARVRQEAAITLGKIGAKSTSEAIKDLLDDENPAVRSAAASALKKLSS